MEKLNICLKSKCSNSTTLFKITIMAFLSFIFLAIPFTVFAEEETFEVVSDIVDQPHNDNHSVEEDDNNTNNNAEVDSNENIDSSVENEGDSYEDSTDEANPEQTEDKQEVEDTNADDLDVIHPDNEDESDSDNTNSEIEKDNESNMEDIKDNNDLNESDRKSEEYKSDSPEKQSKPQGTLSINTIKGGELKKGHRDERVVQLKKDLEKLGFKVPGKGTNQFGPQTEKKLMEFQKYYGLKVTGILNTATDTKLKSILSTSLQKGKKHSNTIQLKKDLAFLGMPVPGKGTTSYGPQTEKTVKRFQSKYLLAVSGIADEITLKKIRKLIAAPLSNGMRREDVKSLKDDLARLDFKVPGKGTNQFGPQTEKKVKEFQKYYSLKTTGTLNEVTASKLNEILSSSLQKGKKHSRTIKLKEDLAFLGMPVPGNGTTSYGPQTERVVKKFQTKYLLAVSGIADEVTLEKVRELIAAPLSNGMRREDVKSLKMDLKRLGFTVPGNNTNQFGPQTKKQVKEFQKYYGLSQTGIVNDSTSSKLKKQINSPFQNGKRHNDTLQLKKDLNKIGFGGIQVTTLYSDFTEKRVIEFQTRFGLRVNGIADEVTLKKIADQVKNPSQKKVVYLDAGHGGYDPGSGANGLREKDLTLDIAKRTQKKLEAAGYLVIMSRITDVYLSLAERTSEANKLNADVFVSVHINAGGGTGIETWNMSKGPKPKESNLLATHIQKETIKQTKVRDRGVKDGNLHVNRESKMPSALIEVGFIDTIADANKLKQSSFLNKAATGIANGIKNFFKSS